MLDKAKDTSEGAVYGCILAGGQKAIPNGPVATVRYRVQSEVRRIAEKVRVRKAFGVSADLKRIDIQELQTDILVK